MWAVIDMDYSSVICTVVTAAILVLGFMKWTVDWGGLNRTFTDDFGFGPG